MAIAFIDSCFSTAASSSLVTSSAMDSTGADFLVVAIGGFRAKFVSTVVTDNKGNEFFPMTSSSDDNASALIYYCSNPTVGSSHTFTYSEAGTYPSITAIAFSSVGCLETQNWSGHLASNTVSTGSVTAASDGSLFIVAGCAQAGTFSSIDSSFTLENANAYSANVSMGSCMAYKIQTTASSENPTLTNSGSAAISASIACFNPSQPSGGGATVHPLYAN